MLELYQTTQGSRGSIAEVWIDPAEGVARKYYKPTGRTIRGTKPLQTNLEEIRELWQAEIYWSSMLRGPRVLEIYDYGEIDDGSGFYIIQEYVGPDLLHFFNAATGLSEEIEDPVAQLVEMFRSYRDMGIYKFNHAMCNMVNDRGFIRAFDFKYTLRRRPRHRVHEMHSITTWLSKIDSRLPEILGEYV